MTNFQLLVFLGEAVLILYVLVKIKEGVDRIGAAVERLSSAPHEADDPDDLEGE